MSLPCEKLNLKKKKSCHGRSYQNPVMAGVDMFLGIQKNEGKMFFSISPSSGEQLEEFTRSCIDPHENFIKN